MNSAGRSIEKAILRMLGAVMLIDGFLTLLFGHRFVRQFRFEPKHNLVSRVVNWFLAWPPWLLRGSAAGQAALGTALLGRAPLSVEELYGKLAGTYAAIDPGWREWFYPEAHKAFDRVLADSLPEGGKVLDLGSGVGANLARLMALNIPYGAYTGVDLTDAMLQQAKKRYGNLPNVKFQQMDLLSDTLPEGPYDLIASTWVFEHLPDPVLVAEKAWERLKPGGRLVLLLEVQGASLSNRVTDWIYPFISAHRVKENEYRRFPGQVVEERRFPGPLGDLLLLVLEKPQSGTP